MTSATARPPAAVIVSTARPATSASMSLTTTLAPDRARAVA
ncbi:hypothetical protein ACIHCV_01265 [Streptomyces sp. NPDC051956]